MIEHLKNKVTTFLQIKKINEVIDSLKNINEYLSSNIIQDLINQYNSRLENMKHYLNNKVTKNFDNLKKLVNSTLENYYNKEDYHYRFLTLHRAYNAFIRYDNPEILHKLIINSGNNPCINFTQGSINTLFNIDEYSIEAFPFSIKRGDKKILEFNAYGLVTNKTIITTNNYRDYVKLPFWKNKQEMNASNYDKWSEAYAYKYPGSDGRQPIFILVKNAFLRGYSQRNDPYSGPQTNLSVSFYNYYGGAQNMDILYRLELNPWDHDFQINEIYRQRRKHHHDYDHLWLSATGNYNIKWR